MRRCSVTGCRKTEVVGVGHEDEPMCQDHYELWLRGHRSVLDRFRALLTAEPKP